MQRGLHTRQGKTSPKNTLVPFWYYPPFDSFPKNECLLWGGLQLHDGKDEFVCFYLAFISQLTAKLALGGRGPPALSLVAMAPKKGQGPIFNLLLNSHISSLNQREDKVHQNIDSIFSSILNHIFSIKGTTWFF